MAISARAITTLNPPFTQAQLSTALQSAFANAGFTSVFSSFTSGTDLVLVYALVVDATKTFGTTYLRIRITNTFVIHQTVFSTWNTANNTGTGNSSEASFTALVNSASVTFNALNGGIESRLVVVTQGTLFLPLGIVSPATMRSSWNLNVYTSGFIFTAATMTVLRGTTANQTGNSDNDVVLVGTSRLGTANVVDNERDIFSGWTLLNQSNQGFTGKTSDDLVVVASSGSTRYDTISKSGTSQQYLIILPGAGGIAVRIA